MTSKTMICCAFAGAILATTLSNAQSAERNLGSASVHHHRQTIREIASRAHERAFGPHRDHVGRSEHTGSPSGLLSGIASVYSGERTANGEFASAGRLTAAHRSLPFGTMVRVTNRGTGRSVVVRINDRGPYVRGRVIDLTPAAARAIGFSGLAPVTLSVVGRG